MSFSPYQSISTGVSDTSVINGPIAGLNTLLAGLGQSAVGACNLALNVTATTLTDVSGCSVTVSPVGANAFAFVTIVMDASPTVTTSNQVLVGVTVVDGVARTLEAHCDDRVSRITASQSDMIPLTAGTHTIKMQAKKAQAGGTFTLNAQHTTISVILFDIP